MISKELQKLSRRELVDIIYQLKKNDQQKQAQITAMDEALQQRRIRLSVAGSIAEAAADITRLFSTAQETADLYLQEIETMRSDTKKECAAMIEDARRQAAEIVAESERQLAMLNSCYNTEYQKLQALRAELQQLEARKHNT